jgi:hypothetical protein
MTALVKSTIRFGDEKQAAGGKIVGGKCVMKIVLCGLLKMYCPA